MGVLDSGLLLAPELCHQLYEVTLAAAACGCLGYRSVLRGASRFLRFAC